jgi:DNA-binding response OmpR family regulator
MNVLIIDDNPAIRILIGAHMKKADKPVQIFSAKNTTEALAQARDIQFDIITLDNDMPDVEGIDIVEDLRELAPNAKLKILTASKSPTLRDKAKVLNIEVIEKPINSEKIKKHFLT